MKYQVHIDHDDCPENPCDWNEWRVVSFNRRHINFAPAEGYVRRDGEPVHIALRSKLNAGTAYVLSYYEHGDSAWMLAHSQEWANTPDKQWDGTSVAGILLWEGKPNDIGKTPEERWNAARSFIETYTAWCNGHVYAYSIEKVVECDLGHEHTEALDDATCCGFYDLEHMFEEIREITADCDEVEVVGPCKDLADYHDVKEMVTA